MSEGVDYATFRLDNVGGAHVYGQMAWPKRAGKFPALVIFQWARPPYPLEKPWVTDRAAEGWLAVNVEPHDVPSDMPQAFYDALPQMLKEYQRINETDRDHNYFLQMYLGDYRAVEFIATRPEWDGRTIVATGISMGGQQSLVTAALNPRITGVVVNVPAGADAAGALHGRDAGYPFWDTSNPRVVETAAYFDVVNFASRITCAVDAGDGLPRQGRAVDRHLDRVQPDRRAKGSRAHDRLAAQPPGDARTADAVHDAVRGVVDGAPSRGAGAGASPAVTGALLAARPPRPATKI